ncbi:sensor histidine kinase [Levilactobacillus hammesii]|uniref:histidine kinase n=1 Tax=Levilactobacillus hammesii DSM 16381 TaxID=1423753 RepID=A0A0R1UJ64_9LACO|nr:ATP-binding protein [Levilactobacillus hammesii]KRL93319.1 signal transduction histidine kinase [Levilactobacillus hammesii DSM 16381]
MLKQSRFISHERYRRILIAAICIALASQVNFTAYTPGFILTLSVLLLPIFLYFNADLNPIYITLAIALASPIFRGILLFISNDVSRTDNVRYVIADMAFYVCYGLLFYIIYWRKGQRNNSSFLLSIIVCDYLANLLEVSILTGFTNYHYRLFQLLFVTALLRSLISCGLAFLYHHFTLLVRDEDHEQQYYHFIWVASVVKSEVYFMRKNITEIENVMKNAYLLNKHLQDANATPAEQEMALNIARDVHEIKKDYQNVICGLGSYFGNDQATPMQLADILKVTTRYIREALKEEQRGIVIDTHSHVDLVIPNHYYVVSILSNLIFNSADALLDQAQGYIRITVADAGPNVIITVSDNGSGMDADTQAMIFQPGFSTKFDETTGNVYRGIGLSHVKIIVQEQFDGDIQVESTPGKGTNFDITLSKQRLTQEATQ